MRYFKLTKDSYCLKKGSIIEYSRIVDEYFIIDSNLFEKNNIIPKEENTISIGIPFSFGDDVTRNYKLKRLIEKK